MTPLEQQPGELLWDYLERLILDPWFEGATSAEIASWAGTTSKRVRKVQRHLMLAHGLPNLIRHARETGEAIGYRGSPSDLIVKALSAFKASESRSKTRNPRQVAPSPNKPAQGSTRRHRPRNRPNQGLSAGPKAAERAPEGLEPRGGGRPQGGRVGLAQGRTG